MKLTLSQQELEQAVRNYVTGMISLSPGTDVSIDFKAGRGDNGITAEVDISYLSLNALPGFQANAPQDAKPVFVEPKTNPVIPAVTKQVPTETATAASSDAPATRKTTGKSLFTAEVATAAKTGVVTETQEPANDSDNGKAEPSDEKPATARKTLFGDAAA